MPCVIEYVWIDGSGVHTRSKTRTLTNHSVRTIRDVPLWNYDGSSTEQASTQHSEVELVPVALFQDPFRRELPDAYIALCKTRHAASQEPTKRGSCRHLAEQAFEAEPTVAAADCWFGLEQEYTLLSRSTGRPLGWPASPNEFPAPQGPYYCSPNTVGRRVAEEHYQACLYAGIAVSGYNAEVLLGQWEFQIGPCGGLESADQLWVARYMLDRVCETHGLLATLDPKPVVGDWNGSGLHTNFSTAVMRQVDSGEEAWGALQQAIERLAHTHGEYMLVCGEGNERRLTGAHETSDPMRFTHGVGDRGASVRIGEHVRRARSGYLEDRRPASNADPYVITASIARSVLLPK